MIPNLSKRLGLLAVSVLCLFTTQAQPHLPNNYFWKQLPNGLQVVVIENNKVPLTTIEIAVKNGAYTEGPEYSGLSHMFEHMFFKANKDYVDQAAFLKRTQELGAVWNGTTDVERVNYFFTFDKDSLNAGLKFMNSAIRYPSFSADEMLKERPVVDGEFQRAESNPGFQIYYEDQQHLWGDLITRKNPIGIHEVINSANAEKMNVIKDKYYVPNNSLLTIVGDVKHDQAFAMAENIFGSWQSSGANPRVKYPIPAFKPMEKSSSFIKESSIAQTPYMVFSWQGPAYITDSLSTVAVDVFTTVLGLNSSKLQQALVNKGLATFASIGSQTTYYTSSVDLYVMPNPNKLKECYDEVKRQIAMFANADYYTDEQLKDAKANLFRNHIRAQEKPSSLASQMSSYWCSTSLDYFTNQDSNYQKITRDDIARLLKMYITNKPMVSGMVIKPELSKQLNAASFFAAN